MSLLHLNGVDYYVNVSGQGVPLVLLHGFTGSSVDWEPFFSEWAKQFQLVCVDVLGHGRSAKPSDPNRYAMVNVAADLAAIITELGLEHVHLLGYSMGGRLALYTAVHYPQLILSLILESASPGLARPDARRQRCQQDALLADDIESEGIPAFVDRWQRLSLWQSQSQLTTAASDHLRQQRLQNDPVGLANSLRGMGTGQQPALWSFLPDVDLPVMLLVGQLDEKFVDINHKMAAYLPQATLHAVSGAGHTVHLERPSEFSDLVMNWLG